MKLCAGKKLQLWCSEVKVFVIIDIKNKKIGNVSIVKVVKNRLGGFESDGNFL